MTDPLEAAPEKLRHFNEAHPKAAPKVTDKEWQIRQALQALQQRAGLTNQGMAAQLGTQLGMNNQLMNDLSWPSEQANMQNQAMQGITPSIDTSIYDALTGAKSLLDL